MSAITLHNLSKRFRVPHGDVRAVDGVGLRLAAGEMLALLGPSGCGKTTLLRLIAGLEKPSAGHIEIDGLDVTRTPPHKRGVGLVPQQHALYPHMTVRDNLWFGPRMRGMRPEQTARSVVEAARRLRIEHLLNRRPASLSGGEARRVALGRALVSNPKILLLDEPLASLDWRLRETLRDEIGTLHRERPLSTIFVTHQIEDALVLGERIAIMHEGRVLQCASAKELRENPATPWVADFIGPRSPR